MNRKMQVLTAALFVGVLLSFAIAFWILPDQSFSEQENRSLKTFPKFTWQKLADGRFGDEMNDYFADQFPIRDVMVGIKGCAEVALGKGGNNGVILGKGGQLQSTTFDALLEDGSVMKDTDAFDPAVVDAALEGIDRAAKRAKVPFSVLLTGRTVDVTVSSSSYPSQFSDALLARVREGMSSAVTYLDTVPGYRARHDAGEYVYFKTDHHWTTLGAYYAYADVMRSFGMEGEILSADVFEKRVVSTDFYGTAWSAGGMKFVPPDTLELWYLGNEDAFEVTADGKELDSFYSLSYLATKDKYSVFLDGTHDVVTVKKPGEERPTLLILKDSFANSVAPFLAQHFDLVLINLSSRNDYTDLTSLADEYDADCLLLLYTLENMITADKLAKLR